MSLYETGKGACCERMVGPPSEKLGEKAADPICPHENCGKTLGKNCTGMYYICPVHGLLHSSLIN